MNNIFINLNAANWFLIFFQQHIKSQKMTISCIIIEDEPTALENNISIIL